ncbi:MAG: oxygen-independent coproporphyrinogen III oxidase [Paracoccaceae bacterium]
MSDKLQLARLGLFDARVPRYTSYPTAAHFSAEVGPMDMRNWLRAIPAESDISLYVHIPFCRRLCWFCACRTQGTRTLSPVRDYIEVLQAELRLLARQLPTGTRLARLHWGGGTPTLLPPDLIETLAHAIFDLLPLADGAEFSVEIDPAELDEARVAALARMGMNRASIGVQDFDPAIQKTIGRVQSFEVTAKAVEMLRATGIHSLNADILYGLPGQTLATVTASVNQLLSFHPDRVALYGYAHVPWMARRQGLIPTDALPRPEERLALFEGAAALFQGEGYQQIGIDHFARPGDGLELAARAGLWRRNCQGYTEDRSDVLIGVGASAISRFPQGYAQNAPATSAHIAAIREGKFSTTRGHRLDEDDRLRARMIEALMCDFCIRTEDLTAEYPNRTAEIARILTAVAEPFEGLVRSSDAGLFIADAARPLTRIVARHLDRYELAQTGHSHAI